MDKIIYMDRLDTLIVPGNLVVQNIAFLAAARQLKTKTCGHSSTALPLSIRIDYIISRLSFGKLLTYSIEAKGWSKYVDRSS